MVTFNHIFRVFDSVAAFICMLIGIYAGFDERYDIGSYVLLIGIILLFLARFHNEQYIELKYNQEAIEETRRLNRGLVDDA